MKRFLTLTIVVLLAGWKAATAYGEDGSLLWLRLNKVNSPATVTGVKGTAVTELQTYWKGGPVTLKRQRGMDRDGYTIKSLGEKTVITAASDAGLLYGAYHLLRIQQSGLTSANLNIHEQPAYDLRILNHWDNPNGTVERGFAGKSIFLHTKLITQTAGQEDAPTTVKRASANHLHGLARHLLKVVDKA